MVVLGASGELWAKPRSTDAKIKYLARLILESKYLVVYTGAGISTAAGIPDYRGPNGVWTRRARGEEVEEPDFTQVRPTTTHDALSSLHSRSILRHVVTQNIDGLHRRSGIPGPALSELHGNFCLESCVQCGREFFRDFPVWRGLTSAPGTMAKQAMRTSTSASSLSPYLPRSSKLPKRAPADEEWRADSNRCTAPPVAPEPAPIACADTAQRLPRIADASRNKRRKICEGHCPRPSPTRAPQTTEQSGLDSASPNKETSISPEANSDSSSSLGKSWGAQNGRESVAELQWSKSARLRSQGNREGNKGSGGNPLAVRFAAGAKCIDCGQQHDEQEGGCSSRRGGGSHAPARAVRSGLATPARVLRTSRHGTNKHGLDLYGRTRASQEFVLGTGDKQAAAMHQEQQQQRVPGRSPQPARAAAPVARRVVLALPAVSSSPPCTQTAASSSVAPLHGAVQRQAKPAFSLKAETRARSPALTAAPAASRPSLVPHSPPPPSPSPPLSAPSPPPPSQPPPPASPPQVVLALPAPLSPPLAPADSLADCALQSAMQTSEGRKLWPRKQRSSSRSLSKLPVPASSPPFLHGEADMDPASPPSSAPALGPTGRLCEVEQCGGRLVDSVVMFGGHLPEKAVLSASLHSCHADLALVLGTSLRVSPARDFPAQVASHGGKLVIVNLQPTPLDHIADLVIRAPCDYVFKQLMPLLESEEGKGIDAREQEQGEEEGEVRVKVKEERVTAAARSGKSDVESRNEEMVKGRRLEGDEKVEEEGGGGKVFGSTFLGKEDGERERTFLVEGMDEAEEEEVVEKEQELWDSDASEMEEEEWDIEEGQGGSSEGAGEQEDMGDVRGTLNVEEIDEEQQDTEAVEDQEAQEGEKEEEENAEAGVELGSQGTEAVSKRGRVEQVAQMEESEVEGQETQVVEDTEIVLETEVASDADDGALEVGRGLTSWLQLRRNEEQCME